MVKLLISVLTAVLVVAGCVRRGRNNVSAPSSLRSSALDRCVALRGNGTHVISHVNFLARMTEEWGVVNGIAGGSSSTISTFLYESILTNPGVVALAPERRPEAIALLLKSIPEYIREASRSPEWSALQSIAIIGEKVRKSGVLSSPAGEWMKAGQDLRAILTAEEVREMVNPDIVSMLANAANPEYPSHQVKIEEAKKSAASLTAFEADDADVFVRPGVLNFPHFVEVLGRVGDFYAGYGDGGREFLAFLTECSPNSRGKPWSEIAAKKAGADNCGAIFSRFVRGWRGSAGYRAGKMLASKPGEGLSSIMITAVLQDQQSIQKLRDFETRYHKGESRQIGISFDAVKFGYWISPGFPDDTLDRWNASNPDGKSGKAISLGQAATWREILEKSPREPSLGEYVPFGPAEAASGAISIGGWADLHPVQVLKAAGCGKVVYLTRRTPETIFITKGLPLEGRKRSGLAELLGMTEADYRGIYSLDDDNSAYSRALRQADGVWCTDWNKFGAGEQDGIASDTWGSPLISKDAELLKLPMATATSPKIIGCN